MSGISGKMIFNKITKEPIMLNNTLFVIKIINGVKYIHFSGYGYHTDDIRNKPYRWVDYTWLMCPLQEALKYGVNKWEIDNQEFVKQYIEDLSFEELNAIFKQENWDVLKESEITIDIDCGTYWLTHNKQY